MGSKNWASTFSSVYTMFKKNDTGEHRSTGAFVSVFKSFTVDDRSLMAENFLMLMFIPVKCESSCVEDFFFPPSVLMVTSFFPVCCFSSGLG